MAPSSLCRETGGTGMGDRKFSWYTVPHPSGMSSLYRLAGPAIEQSGEITCDIYYRPNMKGGHRHNHCNNVMLRKYGRQKALRSCLRRAACREQKDPRKVGEGVWG